MVLVILVNLTKLVDAVSRILCVWRINIVNKLIYLSLGEYTQNIIIGGKLKLDWDRP